MMNSNPWHKIKVPDKDIGVLRIEPLHPLDLYWGRDRVGCYLFIYEYQLEKQIKVELPQLKGINILQFNLSNKKQLILELKEKEQWELFLSVCNDILNTTRSAINSKEAFNIILRRLYKWHDFLQKERSDILSEEKIKGLLGELIFLKHHLLLAVGCINAINYWMGPENSPQDFNVNNSAIEVKCQLGVSTPYINISSINQLSPQLPHMYLYVVTLGKAAYGQVNSINLPNIIKSIQDSIEQESSSALERFLNLLQDAGYIFSEKYLNYNYLLSSESIYIVNHDFPKLKIENIPVAISQITYRIHLNECKEFLLDQPHWKQIYE